MSYYKCSGCGKVAKVDGRKGKKYRQKSYKTWCPDSDKGTVTRETMTRVKNTKGDKV